MSIFIGMRIDDESVGVLYEWYKWCAKNCNSFHALKPQFIYIPVVYSPSQKLDEEVLKKELLQGPINMPVELTNVKIESLGEHGNISLVFESDVLRQRYNFWTRQDRRLKNGSYKPRIPMSHNSRLHYPGWLSNLPIREVTLINEFSMEFNRKEFLEQASA